MPLRPSARGEPGLVRDYGGVKRGEFGALLDLLAVLVAGVDLGVRLANLQDFFVMMITRPAKYGTFEELVRLHLQRPNFSFVLHVLTCSVTG
ncbi:hypothetical protein ROHU_009259 [Labeo rohita]|uniref:Uncharacterized protein n=1 Tax=Labeo rohita TaxID=84645 RepID=A0A498M2L8_LABRO|nr:hypothetical protein ROHU_009259 [Labeo rohita]